MKVDPALVHALVSWWNSLTEEERLLTGVEFDPSDEAMDDSASD